MQAKDVFVAIVRAMGIWFVVQAGVDAVFVALRMTGVLDNFHAQATQDKIFVGFNLLVALILIGLADKIADLVFPTRI